MSSERWLISALLVLHLVAITAASVPDPLELNPFRDAGPAPADTLSRFVTPRLDAATSAFAPVEAAVFRLTTPLRVLTRAYVDAGLRQKWNMFANPMSIDQYVRVVQYVAAPPDGDRVRVFRELALPAQRDDRIRLVHKFTDKAVLNSFETLTVKRLQRPEESDDSDLTPVVTYFNGGLRRGALAPSERIVRTEIWFGGAPMPPTGQRLSESQLVDRWDALDRYRNKSVGEAAAFPRTKPGALDRESDIVWRLEDVREP